MTTLGGTAKELAKPSRPPLVILMVGLQGSGKTTTAAKLAKRLKGEGRRPLLVAADLQRPAAVDQLVTLGKQLDIPVHAEGTKGRPPEICARPALRTVVMLPRPGMSCVCWMSL